MSYYMYYILCNNWIECITEKSEIAKIKYYILLDNIWYIQFEHIIHIWIFPEI